MTTATTSRATWPTEESLVPAAKALNEAFNQTERILWGLDKILPPYMDSGITPDPLPDLATVGTLYSFVETLQTEITELEGHAEDFKRTLRQIDALRLDAAVRARKEARDG